VNAIDAAACDPERQILIANDEEIVPIALRDALKQWGHSVCTATVWRWLKPLEKARNSRSESSRCPPKSSN